MRKPLTERVDVGDGASFIGLAGLEDLEWSLRYADPRDVRFVAAAVVECYRVLLQMPQKRRNEVCAKIKAADQKEKETHADPSTD